MRVCHIMRHCRSLTVAALIGPAVHAQSLQHAEELWKAGHYPDANNEFRNLVQQNPTNIEYKMRWGRLFLDYSQPADAAAEFNDVLKLKKDYPPAILGLALAYSQDFDPQAVALAKKALELDPKLIEAQELLARIALEDNDNPKAIDEAKKALAINPNSVQARALLATMDWLADKKDTPWDPHTAKGYETAAYFFVINRRYEEGIQYYRKALDLDPTLFPARSQLGVNLMRQGRNDEAFQQLEQCYNAGFKDTVTSNALKLIDSYKNFVTYKTDRTILVLNKKEAELLRPYFERELLRIIATYEKKYKMKLTKPVQLEVYPDHDDFAVRTAGLPGMGAILGVTFGYSVSMDSPSGRPPGSFHWAETLWHEMSHVFTLTATGNRVPRWFTEGVAVHEESAINAEWGDRITPDILRAIKEKKLLPVTQLDRGYVHPTEPSQQSVSYYQGGRTIDYITEKWGWDTVLAMLKDYASDEETGAVIRKELNIEPEEFDKRFVAFVEADTKNQVEHFEEWRKSIKEVNDLSKKKDWDAVIKEGTAIEGLYPDYVEPGNTYEFLAAAYKAKNEKPAAIAELQKYVHNGGRNPGTIKELAKDLVDSGNKKEAAAVLDRLNYIYPMDPEQHQMLGDLWLEQGNAAGAILELRAVLARNPLDPAQAHYDLARAYDLNHQRDQAKEEVLSALETAPGFRPAQKLLIELSSTESK
ncbi:MAG: tetratricopeptide repeat protein [Acidobacteriia bacterium]|nr:tetratricopeptide repeat protein [Terriglobia bacterium]MBV8904650.1 tetratricopeptide repeat protein [Terriglobia bacterium]MBV9746296.1 tetratricopeptide repeat protein [Terriglobia bacterium]